MIDPFTVSSHECRWQPCSYNADLIFHRRGVTFCRMHALLVWSVVDEQIRENQLSPEEFEARRLADIEAHEAEARRKEDRLNSPGTIYYLRIGEHIKIGFATYLEQRLTAYPPSSELLAIEDGSLRIEANRHAEFADLRAVGREWYYPRQRLLDHIARIAERGYHLDIGDEWKRRPNDTTAPNGP